MTDCQIVSRSQLSKDHDEAYANFLEKKNLHQVMHGRLVDREDIHPVLYPFQRDSTVWAIHKGRCALFLDTGLGKTFCQLEWARLLDERTLIIAPLSVARQTVREARKIGLDVHYVRRQEEIKAGYKLFITNYDMAKQFNLSHFGAVVLDESSILKAVGGATRRWLTQACQDVKYRLCCTATPAPNDYVELGNHAEFLGVCSRAEMLGTFFINANKEHIRLWGSEIYRHKGSNKGGQEWRLKHHAEDLFFNWLASWSLTVTKPSDLGYEDAGFVLPELRIHPHIVVSDVVPPGNQLFFTHLKGLSHAAEVRKSTLSERIQRLCALVEDSAEDEQWLIWTGLNSESRAVATALSDSVEVRGSDSPENKAQAFEAFQDGKYRFLVTKPRIGGFGMNFQNAHKMAWLGLNWSWESWYQGIRREWRYLQEYPVDVHVIVSDAEAAIYYDVLRKDRQATRLRQEMVSRLGRPVRDELMGVKPLKVDYVEDTIAGEEWRALQGDACERLGDLADESVHLSIYSPPFADLYVYSSSVRDLGNSRDWDEFIEHYRFIIREILRVTKPGRLSCVHVSDIPALAQKDGYIGVRDFPGEVIRAHESEGWVFHGRAFVQKNPQAQAIRTHSKALLFVQLAKDSVECRPALIDQILLFKKEGENQTPVTPVERGELSNDVWIEWAHGVWTGIQETATLQFTQARGADDEKHICPMQLPTIERCIKLYSNPAETVLDPFGGIGSTGYVALKNRRKTILIELKPEYFGVLVNNLREASNSLNVVSLFDWTSQENSD